MTLFEILSNDERIIVLSNSGDGIIVTWNRHKTFQCWEQRVPGLATDKWEEVDAKVLSTEPANFVRARIEAQCWMGLR